MLWRDFKYDKKLIKFFSCRKINILVIKDLYLNLDCIEMYDFI